LLRKHGSWCVRKTKNGCWKDYTATGAKSGIAKHWCSPGAVQTPTLLRRNGITRNIGNSLQTSTVKVVARFPTWLILTRDGVPVHQVKEFSPRLSLGCSVSNPPYIALGLLDHPEQIKGLASSWAHMANYYAMITPEGRGTVRGAGPFADPTVRHALTSSDRRALAEGLKRISEALFAAGAERVFPRFRLSGIALGGGRPQIAKRVPPGRGNLMTIHLFSSCPMGEDKSRCATDSYGRVHGFKNLRGGCQPIVWSAGCEPTGINHGYREEKALHLLEMIPWEQQNLVAGSRVAGVASC
jgi:hypothetical protein